MNGIISGATVSVGFAGYFTQLLSLPGIFAALGIIALIFLVNISGIRQSSIINMIFTIIEAGGLFLVIYSAFSHLETIAMIANLFIFTTFLLVNIAAIVLRYKDEKLKRPFRIPVNFGKVPVFSVIAILLVLFLLCFNIYGLIIGGAAGPSH